MLEYVETRKTFARRVIQHKKNVSKNYNKFFKEFDREMMKIMSFQDQNTTNITKDVKIDVSSHLSNFDTKFRKKIFEIWYNVKLISHLQKRYVNKKLAENKDVKDQLKGLAGENIQKSANVSKNISRSNSLNLAKNTKEVLNISGLSDQEIENQQP